MITSNILDRVLSTNAGVDAMALRIPVGIIFAAHGAQKLFGWFGAHGIEGTAAGYERMGLAPGQVQRLARAQPRDGVGRLRPGRHRRRG